MSVLLQISPPTPSNSYRGLPVLALGFRPFYLLAAAFGALSVLAWVAMYLGWWQPATQPWLGAMLWHAHEMVFGFAAAVVVGFLFTAGKNWTGLQTPQGTWLGILATVWLAARVLMWTGPAWAAIAVDIAFLPLCSASFYRILRRAKSQRNYGLAIALGIMGALNIGFHVATLAGRPDWALHATEAATGLVVIFVTVIGGRIIPMFTGNAIPGARIRRWTMVERSVIGLTLLATMSAAFQAPGPLTAVLAAGAAIAHGIRLYGWNPLGTVRKPILFILHLAYAFLPVGFLLIAAAALGWLDRSTALHALTVGVIGCAIIAMVTRTALGHTGRQMQSGHMEHLAYLCMVLAAVVRVAGPIAMPEAKPEVIAVAGALWALSLVSYLIKYTPFLMRPRIDGKEG